MPEQARWEGLLDAVVGIGADLSLKEISPNHWVAADPCCVSEKDWETLRPERIV